MQFKLQTLAQVFGGSDFLAREQLQYDYWVLSTNYISYAIIYTCWTIDGDGRCGDSDVMVLSRRPSDLTSDVLQIVQEKLRQTCVDYNSLVKVKHDGACPFIKQGDPQF